MQTAASGYVVIDQSGVVGFSSGWELRSAEEAALAHRQSKGAAAMLDREQRLRFGCPWQSTGSCLGVVMA